MSDEAMTLARFREIIESNVRRREVLVGVQLGDIQGRGHLVVEWDELLLIFLSSPTWHRCVDEARALSAQPWAKGADIDSISGGFVTYLWDRSARSDRLRKLLAVGLKEAVN